MQAGEAGGEKVGAGRNVQHHVCRALVQGVTVRIRLFRLYVVGYNNAAIAHRLPEGCAAPVQLCFGDVQVYCEKGGVVGAAARQ